MFNRYREILSIPGALRFSIAGLIARFPMALVGISLILMIKALYGNYALSGAVSAAGVIAFAIAAPILARLVDRYGQAKIMFPSLLVSALALGGLTIAALNLAPPWVLLVLSAIGGATSGAIGAMVRSRWAYVTDKPGQIQAAYSLEAALDEIVFILGPVIATLLSTSVHPAAGLWLTLALIVVGGMWFLSQKETEPPVRPHGEGARGPSVMRNPAMIVLTATFVGVGALFGANDLAVVAFSAERGVPAMAGVLLSVLSVGSLIGALVYGSRTWGWPLWKLFAVGILAVAIGVSTFIFASSIVVLALLMALAGLAIAPTMTNVSTMVQRIVPPERLTEGLTWISTAVNIGISIGAAAAGPLVDVRGSGGGFLVAIAAAWLMVLAAFVGLPTLRKETDRLPGL